MRERTLLLFCIIILLALTIPAAAHQVVKDRPDDSHALVRLLQAKGILSEVEAASVMRGSPPTEAGRRLARLLLDKGLISRNEYESVTISPEIAGTHSPGNAPNASQESPDPAGLMLPPVESQEDKPVGQAVPPVIAAVAPIRALPLAGDAQFRPDALAPVIRIGTDIKMKPFGMLKANFISDSSSPGGNDFPLPGFLGDTGPGNSPEMHFNARASRIGADFEWLGPSKDITVSGKIEADFEGNFSRVNNRNISSIRSNALQLRLAYVRVDKRLSGKTSAFALFGQDWTAFGSSTLPPILETTGLGLGYGILYERAPQFRFGIGRDLGGARRWKFEPEFALVLPAFGNLPANISDQLAIGERQGADSNRPEIQGRLVTQFQLDNAPGVAPAQFVLSGTYGRRQAIVLAANVPAAFKTAFPRGATVDSSRYGLSAEVQLPTRYFTLLAKGFNGEDLRFYFVGNLLSNFNDVFGLTGVALAPSIDGSSNVAFGFDGSGAAVVAPQRPVRARGGFIDLAFPLSRLFHANPEGRNAGWVFSMLYSFDNAVARDVRHIALATCNRSRSDLIAGTLSYRLNKYFSIGYEESYYRTRAVDRSGALPLYRGIPSYQWHDVRQQLSVFTNF